MTFSDSRPSDRTRKKYFKLSSCYVWLMKHIIWKYSDWKYFWSVIEIIQQLLKQGQVPDSGTFTPSYGIQKRFSEPSIREDTNFDSTENSRLVTFPTITACHHSHHSLRSRMNKQVVQYPYNQLYEWCKVVIHLQVTLNFTIRCLLRMISASYILRT